MPFPTTLLLLLAASSLGACSPGAPEGERGGDGRMVMAAGQDGDRMGGPMMDGGVMGGQGMGEGMMDGGMADMRTIRGLLASHEAIERRVEDVPGGVRTVTVSDDPEVTELIRRHVREMKARYDRGQPIRPIDPVFRELFRHRDRATMAIEDVPGGVRVLHRSDDPEVAALIRQHAHRFVSEAAEEGMRRAMRPTPLPEGYRGADDGTEEGT